MTSTGRIIDGEKERRLIDGLRAGDRESLAAVYDAYGGIAYALAARLLGLTAEAEDVVQESFIALWRQADRLDPVRGIRGYLLAIVHHKAVDRVRRRGRRPEAPLDLEAPVTAAAGDPEEALDRVSERDAVRSALRALSSEQRAAVELTYFGGLTAVEAASRLGIPPGTVKSRLRLALNHLRRQLADPA